MTDRELTNEMIKRADEFVEKQKREFAISELEKIRKELHETAEMHSNGNYYLRDEWIDEYIDKHIIELKGEQMPNSLKCRLKKLAYQGLLSEKDLSRLYTDNDVIEELEKIKAEIDLIKDSKRPIDDFDSGCERIKDLLEHYISELKGENNG